MADAVGFFAPGTRVLRFPAWDCLPYDRVPPRGDVVAERLATLATLAGSSGTSGPTLVVTTVAAILQRVAPRDAIVDARRDLTPGDRVDLDAIVGFLAANGYHRTETVREPGEFAVRGDIVDVFAPGFDEPVRIDLFGDEIEKLRRFDALSQLTTSTVDHLTLLPSSEILLDDEAVARFRSRYRELFGAVRGDDPLYEAVSEGIRHPGMEHWLPLFYENTETLFDYVDGPVVLGAQSDDAREDRFDQIVDYHGARANTPDTAEGEAPYNPLPPDALYLSPEEWSSRLDARTVLEFDSFEAPEASGESLSARGRRTVDFAEARNRADLNLFDAVRTRFRNEQGEGQAIAVACHTTGSRDRLAQLLADHDVPDPRPVAAWDDVIDAEPGSVP
ncbi:MAG: transcription-repair coupling factor, partial [Alphaproteobacteria bacterium]|nr:transcription-repair coupling factor [Alphaproteobacteria bacterium]